MSVALKKRGEIDTTVFGKAVTLHASFENIALFEQLAGIGIYAFASRMASFDLRQTDLVYFLWCFNNDRDKDGWTKNEISHSLMSSQSTDIISVVEAFMTLVFGSLTDGSGEDASPKKTRARKVVK